MTDTIARPREAEQTVTTPTVRAVARRARFWVALGVVGAILAFAAFALVGSSAGGTPLSPTNPGAAGAQALAEVLRQQGVEVTSTTSLDATEAAISDPDSTTLVVYDPTQYLTDDQIEDAAELAQHVILVDPTFEYVREIAPEVALAGFVDGAIDADCNLTAVEKAGVVSGGGSGYRLIDDEADATLCLGSDDDTYSLIQLDRDGDRITVLGTTDALSNEFIINDGNAALALNLFGETDQLVWYLPSFEDIADIGPPTTAELSPRWVNPVMLLLLVTAIAAALWQGRRFGPLIIENLPVVVRASETMLGRARLYESGTARLRALDALRVGAIERMAVACGLPRLATVDEVVIAVAANTTTQPSEVRRILVDGVPSSDAELVRMSDELLTLEQSVSSAVRPG